MSRPMKDSGIEWIGEIPQEWETDRLQWHLEEIKVINSPKQTEQVLSLTIEAEEYKLAYPDTLVVNSMNIIIGAVGISNYFGCVSPVYYVFKVKETDDIRYIYYLFTNTGIQKEMRKYAKGILEIRLRISASDMLKLSVPLPPLAEQRRIADFLDRKSAEIDTVIKKTEKSIEEYNKLKQSIISEAVTKGIRPNRKMKPSGIEWIKEIPVEWNSIAPKALFSLRKEKALPGEKQLTASQQYGVVFQDEFMSLTGSKVVTVEKDFDILKHVEAGDFVISMRSFQGGIEYSQSTGSISSAYVMLIPNLNKVFPRFYKWLLKSEMYINALQSTSNLVRDGQAMRYSNFAQVRLYDIPINEQKEIADFLDRKSADIDKLIESKQKLLEEMQTYKKSVIYEYVTGKKEVS